MLAEMPNSHDSRGRQLHDATAHKRWLHGDVGTAPSNLLGGPALALSLEPQHDAHEGHLGATPYCRETPMQLRFE